MILRLFVASHHIGAIYGRRHFDLPEVLAVSHALRASNCCCTTTVAHVEDRHATFIRQVTCCRFVVGVPAPFIY